MQALPGISEIASCALFLDLDGTIVELVDHPDAVRVAPETLRLLQVLRGCTGQALAVISGREIAVIDRLLYPLILPAAGVHGLQRRDACGTIYSKEASNLATLAGVLEHLLGDVPGTVIERKPGGIAVHYRLRPDLERHCRDAVHFVMGGHPGLRLIRGKMVFELTQKGADKGDVISAFLCEPPFRGRTPVFAGDDVTDEAGFAAVNALGGISIKVGDSQTEARFRAESPADLRDWLCDLAGEACRELV
ncbi:MAG TPA: trehalose-phosphatase [Methylocella sp.]|nr:trehalose-phosphatase [Methylocella sp.]